MQNEVTAKKWAREYEKWKTSNQQQGEYCDGQGIKKWEFKAGVRMAREAGLIEKTGRPPRGKTPALPPKFVPIQVTETSRKQEPYCEIRFNGQAGIRIETQASIKELRDLIQDMWS